MARPWELWLRAVVSSWRVGLLSLVCLMLVVAVSYFYLIPAIEGFRGSGAAERRMIRAVSALLLMILLGMLALAVWWTIRRRP